MKKDLLDELMEQLQKLKDEQKKITIPAPIAPHKVFDVITQVVKNHEMTEEERKTFIAAVAMMDGDISAAEMNELR